MKKILTIALLILLSVLTNASVNAQELFKPGARLEAGTEIKDLYGAVWKVNITMATAVTPPSTALKDSKGRLYYTFLRVEQPATVTAGAMNVLDYGVSTANTAEKNSLAIEALLASIAEGSTPTVYVPFGEYRFARAILIKKPIRFIGDNGSIWSNSTKFFFPKESAGVLLMAPAIMENFCLIGAGNTVEWMDGLVIRSVVTVRGVYVKGFYHGIESWGDIGGTQINTSGSYIEKCFASENTMDGFLLGGVDGSAITAIGCDSRDNGRNGFSDYSFLGNTFISCMSHNNLKGHYFVRDKANARTNILAAYCEGGSPASSLSTKTTLLGGIWESGFDLFDGKGVQYK